MQAFIKQHMHYPPDAQKSKTEGTVRLLCRFNKLGQIDSTFIEDSVSPSIDAEAIRIIKQMPAWEPAKLDGTPIVKWQPLDIAFKL